MLNNLGAKKKTKPKPKAPDLSTPTPILAPMPLDTEGGSFFERNKYAIAGAIVIGGAIGLWLYAGKRK